MRVTKNLDAWSDQYFPRQANSALTGLLTACLLTGASLRPYSIKQSTKQAINLYGSCGRLPIAFRGYQHQCGWRSVWTLVPGHRKEQAPGTRCVPPSVQLKLCLQNRRSQSLQVGAKTAPHISTLAQSVAALRFIPSLLRTVLRTRQLRTRCIV